MSKTCNHEMYHADDKPDLDHPCRQTCRGWQQGFERGEEKWKLIAKDLEEALFKIIGRSHSWVITRETGEIEKPIHDSYRNIADAALVKYREALKK